MRQLLLSVVLALAACAPVNVPVAQAQEDMPIAAAEIAEVIGPCMRQARSRAEMEQCKRSVVTPCLREPANADSTMGLVGCYEREGIEWRSLLDIHVQLESEGPRAKQFIAAQAAWEAWLAAECNYQRADATAGSGEQVAQLGCDLDLTADRVIALTLARRAGGSVY